MSRIARPLAAGLALAGALLFVACENGSTPPEVVASGLTIMANPASVTCTAGQSATVSLAAPGGATESASFAFAVQGTAATLTSTGSTATLSCRTPGTAAVSYTVTRGSETASGTVPVTVVAATPLVLTLDRSAVACVAGEQVPVSAWLTGLPAGAAPTTTYTPSNANVTVASDPATNGATATINCVTPGVAAVAVAASAGGQTATASIAVSVSARLAAIPNPTALACTAGETVALGLTLTGITEGATATFQANDASVVVAGTGTHATVTCGQDAGTSAVNFIVTAGGQTVAGTVPVTITAAPPPVVPLVVRASPSSVRCAPGQSTTITLAVTGGSGAPAITYGTSNNAITASGTGLTATVTCGQTAGTSALEYTVTSGTQTAHGTVPVTIDPLPPVATLAAVASPAAVSCFPGQTRTVTLTITGGDDIPRTSVSAPNGNISVSAPAGGTPVTITCATPGTSALNYGVTAGTQSVRGSVPVTIAAPFTSIALTPTSVVLALGASRPLAATFTLAAGAPPTTPQTVTWASSDPTIATVNAAGVITAVGAVGRQAVITATSTVDPSLRAAVPVTVAAPSLVASLTVSPSSVALATGATQQITAGVTLTPGAPPATSTAVTYTSSDPAIASVSASGLVTAGSTGGTAIITVASVAAPAVTQQVGVTVTAILPLRLTIQSLEYVNALGNPAPLDPTNVSGRVFVTLLVDPGSFTPDSIDVAIGPARAVCQRFSAQLGRAMRAAVQTGSADFAPIQCVLNTAAFDHATGAVTLPNGVHQLSANAYYRPNGVAAQVTAVVATGLTLNNISGYFLAASNTPTPAQVANSGNATGQTLGPQGVQWRAGSVHVGVVPVLFGAAGAPSPVSVSLVDNPSGGTVATVAATGGAGALAAHFDGATGAYTATPASGTLTGYTTPNAGSPTAGTRVTVSGPAGAVVIDTSGAPLGAGGGPVLFIDNAAPEPRAQFVSANRLIAGMPMGYINAAFVFADSVQQTAAATTLADYNGVDRVSRAFFFAPNAGQPAAQIVSGGTQATTGDDVPQNISSTAYLAAAKLTDALGNASPIAVTATSGGAPFTFGVINAAPTLSIISAATNIGANARIGASVTTGRTIYFQAGSTSGASFPTNYVVGTLQVVAPAGTFCATSADVDGSTLTGISTTTASAPCPTIAFNALSIDPTTAISGVYRLDARALDLAGNLSPVFTRAFAIDRAVPVVINPLVATAPLTGGQPETFTAQATDNLSLVDQLTLVEYPTASGASTPAVPELLLRYDGTTIGTAFATPFTTSANLSVTAPTFIRAIAMQTPSAANTYTAVNNQTFVTTNGIAIGASDPGANWTYGVMSGSAVQAVLDQSTSQTFPWTFFGSPQGPASVSLTFQPSNAGAPSAAALPVTLSSLGGANAVTVNLVQTGLVNTPFISPFTRYEVYIRSTVPGVTPFASTTAYAPITTSFGPLATMMAFSQPTIMSNSFTVVPGVGGIPSFPTTGSTAVDLLIVASNMQGYAIGFVLPTITLVP
ncbi:MAG: Ig-like domain-containing protein [Gemmatirosa sp.]|nr:Ig-like domain-containing protein [Gemmatirosa sp.]